MYCGKLCYLWKVDEKGLVLYTAPVEGFSLWFQALARVFHKKIPYGYCYDLNSYPLLAEEVFWQKGTSYEIQL